MAALAERTRSAQLIAESSYPTIFQDVWLPGRGAAIWRRRPSQLFQNWIDALPAARLPEARVTLAPDRVEEAATILCRSAGMEDGVCRTMLAGDCAALASLFAQTMAVSLVRLRLDVVRDDACSLFHIDNVPARLLCTYRGRGTEYGLSLDDGKAANIASLPTGAAGLFRGRLFPSDEVSGIVHRSPPIDGTGETRLLLVIDAAEEPDD